MAQKDMREKLLEDYNDVFSDIFNGLLFEENVIEQQYLKAGSTESIYKAENGKYREQRRDVLKDYMESCFLEIGSLGIENQSEVDKYIPVRVMGYDYTKYRSQVDKEVFPLRPVITIVLNFSNIPWKNRKSIHDITTIPEKFKSYVQDYEVKVFDIAFLEDEVIERFTSDFKLVAKFFKSRRLENGKLFTDEKICHVQEFMDFLAVFTNDIRYKEIKEELAEMEKDGRSVTMCNIAQALEDRGIEKGIEQEKISRIQKMLRKGYSKEDILEWEYTEDEYEEAKSQLPTM